MENKLKTPIRKHYLVLTVTLFVLAFVFVYFNSRSRRAQQSGQTLGSYNKSVRLSEDNLSLVRKEHDNKIFLNVCNDTYLKSKQRQEYPHVVEVKIPLKKPNEIGLPTKTENEFLYTYEDDLRQTVEADTPSLYTVTSSGDAHRSFIIYSKEPDAVKTVVDSLQDKIPDYEADYTTKEDKSWSVYDRLCQDEK